jgi:hypothetical protein
MTISIPIISEFNGKGIDKAKQEFKQLETVGQKAQFAIKKAAIPAALAVGALAAAGKSALAAGEEVNSANNRILQINTAMGLFGKETEDVTKRIVKLAEAQGTELGISNLTIKATQAKLLTFKNLAKSAKTVGGAFDRANKAALDMAAAGFGSAEGNAVQLGKALENPIKGIAALAKSGVTFTEQEKEKIATLVESNKMLEAQDMVLKAIEAQVGGTAKATADDTKRMQEGFAQFQQSLGLGLLPILEAVTPVLLGMANWAKENPGTFKVLAAAIGAIALSILAINFAMAANPITLIGLGIAAVIGAVILAYKRFETFRNIVDTIFSGIKIGFGLVVDYLKFVAGIYKGIFNGIAKAWNNTVGKISFEIPSWVPKIGGKGFSVPQIPMLAQGGIVNQATLAVIGEAGPEAVIPLDRMGEFGAAGGGINITVNAGLLSSPDQVGQQIIEAIQKAQRRSGVVFAPA